jgi:hypothetical protein
VVDLARVSAGITALALAWSTAVAQPGATTGQFAPAANVVFFTDFSGDPVGSFPSNLQWKRGPLDVASVNGVNMLRSTGEGEFLIPLPGRLPADFTIEFEFIARGSTCCAGDELTFEGGPLLDESAGSAHIIFNQTRSDIRGGGITGAAVGVQFPDALKNEFPGQLVTIQAQFNGPAFKYFVNGRLIRNIPQLVFRRTTVIRVLLGGVNDALEVVYLKSIRLATGLPMALTSTGTSSGAPTPPPGRPQPGPVTSNSQPATAGLGITVTASPAGPVVTWTATAAGATYAVRRWNSSNPTCCNASSPALSGPPWQDSPLSAPGTYIYEVTMSSSAGTSTDQAQYQNLTLVGTQTPATVAPAPATPAVIAPANPAATATTPAPGFSVTIAPGANGWPRAAWSPVPNAIGYQVHRWKTDDPACCTYMSPRTQWLTGTSWQDIEPQMPGIYTYEVIASTQLGLLRTQGQFTYAPPGSTVSTPNPITSASTVSSSPGTPLPKPTINRPTNMNTGPAPSPSVSGTPASATVSWSAVAGATGYEVSRQVAGATNWTAVTSGQITGTSVVDQPLDFRLAYTYQVVAYQSNGTYGSAMAAFQPPKPVDPASLTAAKVGAVVQLTWPTVSGVTLYLVSGPGIAPGTPPVTAAAGALSASYVVNAPPNGTNVYQVASVYQPGGVLTTQPDWPSASITLSPSSAGPGTGLAGSGSGSGTSTTCACTKTGKFANASLTTIDAKGLVAPFTSNGETYTIQTRSLGSNNNQVDITDSKGNSVLSQGSGASAWGRSPDDKYFTVVTKSSSLNTSATVDLYRIAPGPGKWTKVLGTMAYADGLWGFSPGSKMFIVTRFQNGPKQFSVEAYNLESSNPANAKLDDGDTNVSAATVTVSPCEDRLLYFRWTQLNPLQGQGTFYRRTVFPTKTVVTTQWDGQSQTLPTAEIIDGGSPPANNFLVQLNGLMTSSGQHTIPSLQCNP